MKKQALSVLLAASMCAGMFSFAAPVTVSAADAATTAHLQQDDWSILSPMLDSIYGWLTTTNSIATVTQGSGSWTSAQVVGNGDIGAACANVSNANQQFYFGKNDFWGALHCSGSQPAPSGSNAVAKSDNGVLNVGGLDIFNKNGAGTAASTSFNSKQDIKNAQIITNMQLKDDAGANAGITMTSWTADIDNVFVTTVQNNGANPITLNARAWMPSSAFASGGVTPVDAINIYPYTAKVDTTTGSPVLLVTRTSDPSTTSSLTGRIAEATALVTGDASTFVNTGTSTQTKDFYIPSWSAYQNSFGADGDFTVPAGGKVSLVTYFASSGGTTSTAKSVATLTSEALAGVTQYASQAQVDSLYADHVGFWKDFWLKSYADWGGDSTLNRYYYGSLYIVNSSDRAPRGNVNKQNLPGAMYGPWILHDGVGWGGRYFLNYNQQAHYYGSGSTNRIDQARPYCDVMAYDLPYQKNNAAGQGYPAGTAVWNRTLGPWHYLPKTTTSLNSPSGAQKWGFNSGSTDQKSNGTYAIIPLVFYYEYTLDNDFLANELYPAMKALTAFYSNYVLKQDDGNGQYHYAVIGSSIHEGDSADIDASLDMGAIKFMTNFLIDHYQQAGDTTVTPAQVAQWKDIYDHTNFPEGLLPSGSFDANNHTTAYNNNGSNMVPTITATNYQSPNQAHVDLIEPGDQPVELEGTVFPFENNQILGGDRLTLQKVNNTLLYMNAWSVGSFAGWSSQNNGFCKVYPIAARSGYPPATVISNLKSAITASGHFRATNLTEYQSGGAVETVGTTEALDSMVLQSTTSSAMPTTLQVFPNWTGADMYFERLGAMGNVSVSSRMTGGVVNYVDITSRRDGQIALVNPFVGTPVINVVDGTALGAQVDYSVINGKIVFNAAKGVRYMVTNGGGSALPADLTLSAYSGTLVNDGAATASVTATVLNAAKAQISDAVTCAPADPSLVSVTQNGNVFTIKALAPAKDGVIDTTLTFSNSTGISQPYKLKLVSPSVVPDGITILNPATATIYGPSSTASTTYKITGSNRLQLTAFPTCSGGQIPYDQSLVWLSSNNNVAMVDKNGLVIARGTGTTTVKAIPAGNRTAAPVTVCTVTVTGSSTDYAAGTNQYLTDLSNALTKAAAISPYASNTTSSGGFTRAAAYASNPRWVAYQSPFQMYYINAMGVKNRYSGYSAMNMSADTVEFAAIGLNYGIGLITNAVDPTVLQQAVAKAATLTELNFDDPADWDALGAAVTAGNAVLAQASPTQADINAAAAAINAIIAKAVIIDKTALEKAISAATAANLTELDFNNANDWGVFSAALSAAQAVDADVTARQPAIDAAAKALTDAFALRIIHATGNVINLDDYANGDTITISGQNLVQFFSGTNDCASFRITEYVNSYYDGYLDYNTGWYYMHHNGSYPMTVSVGGKARTFTINAVNVPDGAGNLSINAANDKYGTSIGSVVTAKTNYTLSYASGSYQATNAFDGNPLTFVDLSPAATPNTNPLTDSTTTDNGATGNAAFFSWDFGSNPQAINMLTYVPRPNVNCLRIPGMMLQGANDAAGPFTTIYMVPIDINVYNSANNNVPASSHVVYLNNTTAYRFYRWIGGNSTSAQDHGAKANVAIVDLSILANPTIPVLPQKYTVTYDLNGGSGSAPSAPAMIDGSSFTVADGGVITPPAGMAFKAWNTAADGTGATCKPGDTMTIDGANITLYPIWLDAATAYAVTFDSKGGGAVDPQSVLIGQQAVKPADPARPGYSFDGWFLNGALYNFSTPVRDAVTLTAQWTPIPCTVAFDPNNGGDVTYVIAEGGSPVAKPANPVKANSVFLGWFTDGGALYDFSAPLTGDLNLIAQWTYVDYGNINFEQSQGQTIGQQPNYPNLTLRTGTGAASLFGPNDNTATKYAVIAADPVGAGAQGQTLKAQGDATAMYTPFSFPLQQGVGNSCTASFKFMYTGTLSGAAWFEILSDSANGAPNDISPGPIASVNIGGVSTNRQQVCVRAGTNSANVNVPNASLAPNVWHNMTITVHFGNSVDTGTYDVNADGYVLNGIQMRNQGTTPANNAMYFRPQTGSGNTGAAFYYDDISLPNAATPVNHTVTFDPAGGTLSSPATVTVKDGDVVAKPADPTRTDGEFLAWTLNGQNYDFSTPVTSDITLTAAWSMILGEMTITFDPNGGTLTSPAEVKVPLVPGSMLSQPTDPVRQGYNFTGWFIDKACTMPYNFSDTVMNNFDPTGSPLILYAGWSTVPVTTYTVTFNANGAPNPPAQSVPAGTAATRPADPVKTGYTFGGWYNGAAAWNFNDPVTANLTLTAQWTINTYTVAFDSAGGSAVATQTVQYNAAATAPAAPTRANYNFAGWYLGGSLYNFSTPVTANITLVAQWTPIVGPLPPPTSITMSAAQTSLNMKVGTKLTLQITVNPANADPSVTWSSSNPAVATVDPVTGQVTAIKTGSVRITVKSNADPTVSYMFLVMINA